MNPTTLSFCLQFFCRLSLATLLLASVTALHAAETKPNVLFILTDDQGWRDVGYNAPAGVVETPNIDRLGRSGLTFSQAYAPGANCAPSRASILSGQYSPRHEVYAVNSTARAPKDHMSVVPVPNAPGLASRFITMAETLREAGYATAHLGKWHLNSSDPKTLPLGQGFDFSTGENFFKGAEGEAEDPNDVFALTAAAQSFIKANRDRPFFLYLAHYAPHTPIQARPADLARFRQRWPDLPERDVLYAACLFALDESIGRLLESIEQAGVAERTLIVFTSDNGSIFPQPPLRGLKGSFYDGGLRVPLIAAWPGTIVPDRRSDRPVGLIDLYPTFVEVAGAAPPSGQPLDGGSLAPLLLGREDPPQRDLFWHFPGYLGGETGTQVFFRSRPVSIIRRGDWKLHLFHEPWALKGGREQLDTNGAVALYNLAQDPGERADLAQAQPVIRDELLDALLAWLVATEAKLPTEPNPRFSPRKPMVDTY